VESPDLHEPVEARIIPRYKWESDQYVSDFSLRKPTMRLKIIIIFAHPPIMLAMMI
jgi:hypothetical protein